MYVTKGSLLITLHNVYELYIRKIKTSYKTVLLEKSRNLSYTNQIYYIEKKKEGKTLIRGGLGGRPGGTPPLA